MVMDFRDRHSGAGTAVPKAGWSSGGSLRGAPDESYSNTSLVASFKTFCSCHPASARCRPDISAARRAYRRPPAGSASGRRVRSARWPSRWSRRRPAIVESWSRSAWTKRTTCCDSFAEMFGTRDLTIASSRSALGIIHPVIETPALQRVVDLAGAVRGDDDDRRAGALLRCRARGYVTWKSERISRRNASNASSARSSSLISSTGGPATSGSSACNSGRLIR